MRTLPTIIAAILLGVSSLHAQLVADGATNTLANTTNSFTGDVTVGTNGSFTLLTLSNNVLLTNTVNGIIGRNLTAKSNEVRLISNTARWRMGGTLFVGSNGANASLTVSNGAFAEDTSASFGFRLESSNNVAVITDPGSLWSNRFGLNIGGLGRANQMIVSNGGWVVSRSALLGVDASGSNNFVLVSGSGSVWSNATSLSVGSIAPGNRLVIEGGGRVDCDSGVVGDFNSASNNEAVVTGPGSLWINHSGLSIGSQIGHNRLVVSNGAAVWCGQGSVGSLNNQVIVTGSGSVWSNQTFLFVTGGTNRVDVSNDGWLVDGTGEVVGRSNIVTLAGSGSGWNNTDSLFIGNLSDAGALVVSNGATVLSSNAMIGSGTSLGNNNYVLLTGTGTLWSNRSDLTIGNFSVGNRLIVSNGAVVFAGGTSVLGANAGANSNSAVVSGADWFGSSSIVVGSNGAFSSLLITNTAIVSVSNVIIGYSSGSTNNRIIVDGGMLLATNATGTGMLDVRRGTNVLNAGLIDVNQLVLTNKGSNLVFTSFGNGGSMTIPAGGPASPYPSTITVSGLAGSIAKVTVTLSNLSHTFPSDLDILLISPTGQKVMIMSDVGGSNDIVNVRLNFDDAAGIFLPLSGPIPTGTYKPTDYLPGETMPGVGPGPYSSSLSSFIGNSPNGSWSLYVNDAFNPDGGSLVGWGLQIATDLAPDRGAFEFNGGTLITRVATINNGAPFVVGTSGTNPAVWDVRAGPSNSFIHGDMIIGNSSSFNQLFLTNGALLTNSGFCQFGLNTVAKSNSVTLAGAGSRWLLDDGLTVGEFGSGNRLIVSNGAVLVTGSSSSIGNEAICSNNEVVVTGPESTWTSAVGHLFIGGGRSNRLVVSDGGQVTCFAGRLGDFFPESSNNLALVTGVGSVWSNATELRVGDAGRANFLVLTNGGALFAGTTVSVGFTNSSTNNRVTVDGGTLRATNLSATGTLDLRRGTNALKAGLVEVDVLRLTNILGWFEFSGGVLSARSTIYSNSFGFEVGNGVSPSTFFLAGNGTHSFGNGLVVKANATLSGNGTVGGATAVLPGATLSPGASIGKLVFTGTFLPSGTFLMELSKNGTTLTNDQVQTTGSMNYGGDLVVTNVGPSPPAAGDKFKLFIAPGYLSSLNSITLPPLPPGLSWLNNLLVDGSIEVFAPPAIAMSSGSYTQDFDGLSITGNNFWRDNSTLLGWYAARTMPPPGITNYLASDGSLANGALYSFGSSGSSDRALGSIATVGMGDTSYGLCLTNDTAKSLSNFIITYTGEQWRCSGGSSEKALTFWYKTGPSAITDPEPGVVTNWTEVTNLDFTSPTVLPSASALNGNAPNNRHVFSSVLIPGLIIRPGQNVFFRWRDIHFENHGMALDDLVVAFSPLQPQLTFIISTNGVTQLIGVGESNVNYAVEATTNLSPPAVWQRIGSNLANGTGVFQFTDTNASAFPTRFYRALTP